MNKFVKHIITIFVAITFLISSIGVRFESPCCENDEKEIVKIEESSCCSVEEEPKASCCETELPEDHSCKIDCEGLCFSTYSYYKLDIDQITTVLKTFEAESNCSIINFDYINELTESTIDKLNLNKPPPNLWGKLLILSLQQPKLPSPLSV